MQIDGVKVHSRRARVSIVAEMLLDDAEMTALRKISGSDGGVKGWASNLIKQALSDAAGKESAEKLAAERDPLPLGQWMVRGYKRPRSHTKKGQKEKLDKALGGLHDQGVTLHSLIGYVYGDSSKASIDCIDLSDCESRGEMAQAAIDDGVQCLAMGEDEFDQSVSADIVEVAAISWSLDDTHLTSSKVHVVCREGAKAVLTRCGHTIDKTNKGQIRTKLYIDLLNAAPEFCANCVRVLRAMRGSADG